MPPAELEACDWQMLGAMVDHLRDRTEAMSGDGPTDGTDIDYDVLHPEEG